MRDRIACAVTTALGDLLSTYGNDDVAAAALMVARAPRFNEWFCSMVHESRHLRVASAAGYLLFGSVVLSLGSCLGVSAPNARSDLPTHIAEYDAASPNFRCRTEGERPLPRRCTA